MADEQNTTIDTRKPHRVTNEDGSTTVMLGKVGFSLTEPGKKPSAAPAKPSMKVNLQG